MQIGSTVWDDTVQRRSDDLDRMLCRNAFGAASRQEEDWLERWDDDGGAPLAGTPVPSYGSLPQPWANEYYAGGTR